ncbi:thioredoxin family protein [Sediminibacterium roseum]|uniref:Thioredoxin family protein n=1 Tax=Sediminibacterium roseum TaxID=1978412 RepID=A0ABW9ZW39_9BACT|nr:thioredoxin fold domain-containing protein [Sediminibacterium roseum]NCI51340.1 thioredoxin family protein [Sediminibacterium roseum]
MRKIIIVLSILTISQFGDLQGQIIRKSNGGIIFRQFADWSEVRTAAKKENKLIFVDCFTTWCAPCRAMEHDVFSTDTVGSFFNSHFISIRLQFDQTKGDNAHVKSWYGEVKKMDKKFSVDVYPSFLVFDSTGQIVHRGTSYQNVNSFLAFGKTALDPKTRYYSLLNQYDLKLLHPEQFPAIIKMSTKFGNVQYASRLSKDFLSYLVTRPEEEWYSKEAIAVISDNIRGKQSRFYKMFTSNPGKVNKVTGGSASSQRVLDTVIGRSFLNHAVSIYMSQGKEPAWDSLSKVLTREHDVVTARRNILLAKLSYYEVLGDREGYLSCFVELVAMNAFDLPASDSWLNYVAYSNIYGDNGNAGTDDSSKLSAAINWMDGVVSRARDNHVRGWYFTVLDTYFMLLYKGKQVDRALEVASNGLKEAIGDNNIKVIGNLEERIQQIKSGRRTWLVEADLKKNN